MACVGPRFGAQRAAVVKSAAWRLFGPARIQTSAARIHSQARAEHFVVNEYGLLSSFVATPWRQRPSIFSKAGLSSAKLHVVEWAREVSSWATIKWYLSGWKSKVFAAQAEELYGIMNTAFAEGDAKTLSGVCFPNLLSKLKNDIKRRKGAIEWHKERTVKEAEVVQIRCGRLTTDFCIGQVVVRVDQEQLVAAAGKKAAGKAVHVTEYVVFQRVVSDPSSPWSIYGKLAVPQWDK